jgi:ABC-type phosphate transport system substrate-binding protein
MKSKLLLILACLTLAAIGRGAEYQIIAHPGVDASSLTKADAKNLLLGNKARWDNGVIVRLAVLSGGKAHDDVITELTSRTPDQFDKYWKKQVFTGKGVMPESAADDAAMLAYVAKTPGSLGYISSQTEASGVKILPIQ